MTKNKKVQFGLILSLTLSLVFVLCVPKAFAVFESLNPIHILASIFDTVILGTLSLVLALGGYLFDWVIGITKFTEIEAVTAGWKIVRDFVNVSFIFVLLVIAISTILGIEKFGMKQLFVKLIIVALLVNFSMLMCNIIIDTTNLLTHFFIDGAGLNSAGGISSRIMAGLGVAKIYQASSGAGAGNVLGSMLISMILSVVVMLGAVIVVWLATGLLIVRIIVLSFLIIVSPAAFLFRILPNTQDLWSKWWKTFINYCLFAPAFAFFLYLALLTAQESTKIATSSPFTGLPAAGNSFFTAKDTLIHYIIFMGLLIGAIFMGKQFGIYGGAKVYGMATAGMKKVSGYNFAKTKGTAVAKEQWKNVKGRTGQWASERLRSSRIPGTTRLADAISSPGQHRAQQRADIAEERKKMEHFSDAELTSQLDTASGKKLVALMEELAKRGSLDNAYKDANGNVDASKIENALKTMERLGGNTKDVLRNRADWAEHAVRAGVKDYAEFDDTAQGIADAIEKAIKTIRPEHANNISREALDNPIVAQRLLEFTGPAHLEQIARNNIPLMNRLQVEITNANNQGTLSPRHVNYINSQLGQGMGWHL